MTTASLPPYKKQHHPSSSSSSSSSSSEEATLRLSQKSCCLLFVEGAAQTEQHPRPLAAPPPRRTGRPSAWHLGGEERGGTIGVGSGPLRGHPQPGDGGHLQLHHREREASGLRRHAHDGASAGVCVCVGVCMSC